LTECMLVFLQVGGLQGGGINFDAKTRRNSTDLDDIFHAHIGGMDVFARALLIANDILKESHYKQLMKDRYSTFNKGKGAKFANGKLTLEDLSKIARKQSEPQMRSGKQEMFENLINQYI
jgi:xylose isomerase